MTEKLLDYEDWKKLIDMKEKKMHLTSKGLIEMKEIKNGMNKGRKKV